MRAAHTITALSGFTGRGAGSDAERRAAGWLAAQLQTQDPSARVETFWSRPNWALAHAWHVALGLGGSLLAVHSPRVGGALILIALLCVATDELSGLSPGRRLTPERASQNVLSGSLDSELAGSTRLIITSSYDAGRTGLVFHPAIRGPAARARRALGALAIGWLGWLVILLVWLLAVAIARLAGAQGSGVGLLQLIPTVGLVLALALLLELGTADFGAAAGDNASGTAIAVELVRALRAAPPAHCTVQLVLQGASDASGLGLKRHLRQRRRQLQPADTIVLGIGPCAHGSPAWWISDGPLLPVRYLRQLRELCAQAAESEPARPIHGRGTTPALPARTASLPAITIGCLDASGRYPLSHRQADTPDQIDEAALASALSFGLMLADGIDSYLAQRLRQA